MNHYQDVATTFANYDDQLYPVVALSEEVGEVSRLFAKVLRGDDRYTKKTMNGDVLVTDAFLESLKGELGDVLWNIQELAGLYGFTLQEIADYNIEKLTGRKVKGVIKGDGDDR